MVFQKNKYRVIVIDPPWNQGKTGKRKVRPNQTTILDYPTMSKAELESLPLLIALRSKAICGYGQLIAKIKKLKSQF